MKIHELESLLAKCGIRSIKVDVYHRSYYASATLLEPYAGTLIVFSGPHESLQQACDAAIDAVLALGPTPGGGGVSHEL